MTDFPRLIEHAFPLKRVLPASVKNFAGASARAWLPVGMTGEGSGRSAAGADE